MALLFPGAEAWPGRAGRPVDKFSVVLVAIFGVLFLGERLSATGWLGIALVAVGILLITLKP